MLQSKHKYNALFFAGWIVISAYLLLRAYFIDITDDEAWSYYNVKKFWWVEALCSGNTHWFNFAAIKMALLLGFEKAWQLRWLSVLSGITFLYIGYLWIITLKSWSLKCLAFSLLFLNPYLLEYLTLARGYSAALCFMVLSLYSFVKLNTQKGYTWTNSLPLFFAGCSAIANFNFFYFFIPFMIIYFIKKYFKQEVIFYKNKRFYVDALYSCGIIFLVLRALLFIKVCSNDIGGFGGDELIGSVFCTYIDTLFYGKFYFHPTLDYWLGFILFLVLSIASVVGVFKIKSHKNNLYLVAGTILLGMICLTIFNNWCFHVLYPIGRTTLMFYPLATIVVVQFLNFISMKIVLQEAIHYIMSSVLIFNFCVNTKLVSGYDYSYCMNTSQYFDYLGKMPIKKVGLSASVYFVYLKYYYYINCNFYAESLDEYRTPKRYIFNNKLEDFEYLLLLYPYNLKYYKGSNVKLQAVKYFPKTKGIIVKVEKKD